MTLKVTCWLQDSARLRGTRPDGVVQVCGEARAVDIQGDQVLGVRSQLLSFPAANLVLVWITLQGPSLPDCGAVWKAVAEVTCLSLSRS